MISPLSQLNPKTLPRVFPKLEKGPDESFFKRPKGLTESVETMPLQVIQVDMTGKTATLANAQQVFAPPGTLLEFRGHSFIGMNDSISVAETLADFEAFKSVIVFRNEFLVAPASGTFWVLPSHDEANPAGELTTAQYTQGRVFIYVWPMASGLVRMQSRMAHDANGHQFIMARQQDILTATEATLWANPVRQMKRFLLQVNAPAEFRTSSGTGGYLLATNTPVTIDGNGPAYIRNDSGTTLRCSYVRFYK